MTAARFVIGLISDTHGLVRPEAMAALEGSDLIIHAGDIGAKTVLDTLQAVAPVVAIRGNNDTGRWAKPLPRTRAITIGRVAIYVIHNANEFEAPHGCYRVIISGHSHRPSVERLNGVLFVNPGSAGPRRFSLPVSVARLDVHGDSVNAKLIELNVPRPSAPRHPRAEKRGGSTSTRLT
jgi:uncharacterized protein